MPTSGIIALGRLEVAKCGFLIEVLVTAAFLRNHHYAYVPLQAAVNYEVGNFGGYVASTFVAWSSASPVTP